jgi:UDP-glucose 4-epimerase
MGISKAMMEKVMVAASRNLDSTMEVICGTRYGNVMASHGSVIPLFVQQVLEGKQITITDPSMTRFMMTLSDAVDLVSARKSWRPPLGGHMTLQTSATTR